MFTPPEGARRSRPGHTVLMYGNDFAEPDDPGAGPLNAADGGAVEAAAAHVDTKAREGLSLIHI